MPLTPADRKRLTMAAQRGNPLAAMRLRQEEEMVAAGQPQGHLINPFAKTVQPEDRIPVNCGKCGANLWNNEDRVQLFMEKGDESQLLAGPIKITFCDRCHCHLIESKDQTTGKLKFEFREGDLGMHNLDSVVEQAKMQMLEMIGETIDEVCGADRKPWAEAMMAAILKKLGYANNPAVQGTEEKPAGLPAL